MRNHDFEVLINSGQYQINFFYNDLKFLCAISLWKTVCWKFRPNKFSSKNGNFYDSETRNWKFRARKHLIKHGCMQTTGIWRARGRGKAVFIHSSAVSYLSKCTVDKKQNGWDKKAFLDNALSRRKKQKVHFSLDALMQPFMCYEWQNSSDDRRVEKKLSSELE